MDSDDDFQSSLSSSDDELTMQEAEAHDGVDGTELQDLEAEAEM